MEEMLTRPVLLLALAMILATGIERLLELIRAIWDYFESNNDSYEKKWRERTEKLREHIEKRLDNAKTGDQMAFNAVLTIITRHLSVNPKNANGTLAISVDKVRTASIRLRYKTLAIAMGIAFAFIFQIDIIELVRISTAKNPEAVNAICATTNGMIISGIAMGFGAGPVHKLITAMERARRFRKAGDK